MKIKYLLLIFVMTISCNNKTVALYYYNGLEMNKNNTWGSSLQIFFEKNDGMTKVFIKDNEISQEITEIKVKIMSENKIIVPDDGNYMFAFVNKKDTLFADDRLEFWRSGNKGLYKKLDNHIKDKILKYYKPNPNQQ